MIRKTLAIASIFSILIIAGCTQYGQISGPTNSMDAVKAAPLLNYTWLPGNYGVFPSVCKVEIIINSDGNALISYQPSGCSGEILKSEKRISLSRLKEFADFVEGIGYFNQSFPKKKVDGSFVTHWTDRYFWIRIGGQEKQLYIGSNMYDFDEITQSKISSLSKEIINLTGTENLWKTGKLD